jgi:Flp pilus assembly protein TadG
MQDSRRSIPARTAHRRGSAAVELGVVLSVLTVIAFGCVDLGRFAYTYIAVTNAARAGAAYGIMNNYSNSTIGDFSTSGTWKYGILQAAQSEMPSLTASNLTVPTPSTANGLVEANGLRRVHVEVSYQFQTLIPLSGLPFNLGLPSSPMLYRAVEMRQIR